MQRDGLSEFSLDERYNKEEDISRQTESVMVAKNGIEQYLDDLWGLEYDQDPMTPGDSLKRKELVTRQFKDRSFELYVEQDMPDLYHMQQSASRRQELAAVRKEQFNFSPIRRAGDVARSKKNLEASLAAFDCQTDETLQLVLSGGKLTQTAVAMERPHIIVLIAWLCDDETSARTAVRSRESTEWEIILSRDEERQRLERDAVNEQLAQMGNSMPRFDVPRRVRDVVSGYNQWQSGALYDRKADQDSERRRRELTELRLQEERDKAAAAEAARSWARAGGDGIPPVML
jgi:hypothetical protein